MKHPGLIFLCLYCCFSNAEDLKWRDECVGYYQFQLPENIEVAVEHIDGLIHPLKRTQAMGAVQYIPSKITFGLYNNINDNDTTQAQFSNFIYDDHDITISTKNDTPLDIYSFERMLKENIDFKINYLKNITDESNDEFNRATKYIIREYENAFSFYKVNSYSLYIIKNRRVYRFYSNINDIPPTKTQTTNDFLLNNESKVVSLMNRFLPRQLYEVPSEPGFCLPYGFVANDSGHEPRNMVVTYRMKDHPDVTILFQDASFQYPEMLPQTERGGRHNRKLQREGFHKMDVEYHVSALWR
ncbi:hypothetical protein CHU32_27325 [Superficieibacter electus]|uniref:Tle cognate immunity protein 4 C-terminal domain-containing protein n=1 Tax=Superficieibacter electus TaxID=2022662 RepID=A0A2P5GGS2_9ENTR|nr:T6SS immunity protein Tli4 family protein [Superficieibacter electus]POP40435.1 hypothetical protein CHU33_27285 [Superficieibacter electus]POP41005.1 hypothetical protein CHU32_27325 [Superficieibacter electus]